MTTTDSTHITTSSPSAGIAQRLAEALAPFIGGGELPVRLRAWDGSETGSPDGPLVVLTSRRRRTPPPLAPGRARRRAGLRHR